MSFGQGNSNAPQVLILLVLVAVVVGIVFGLWLFGAMS
jgi:hypothetical protein